MRLERQTERFLQGLYLEIRYRIGTGGGVYRGGGHQHAVIHKRTARYPQLIHRISTCHSVISWLSSMTTWEIPSVYELFLIMNLCMTCLSAGCAVVCWRRGSELTSKATRIRQAIESAESSESRIDELRQKINSLSRKYALEDRRDPETGLSRSRRRNTEGMSKEELRREYGLNGLSHADIARRAMRGVDE